MVKTITVLELLNERKITDFTSDATKFELNDWFTTPFLKTIETTEFLTFNAVASVEKNNGVPSIPEMSTFIEGPELAGHMSSNQSLINQDQAGRQRRPEVTTLMDGTYVVVWESYNPDTSEYSIWARNFSSNGSALTDEYRVDGIGLDISYSPSVVSNLDGGYSILWAGYDQSSQSTTTYVRQFDNGGLALTGAVQTIDVGSGSRSVARDAQILKDGHISLLEIANSGGGNDQLLVSIVSANGFVVQTSFSVASAIQIFSARHTILNNGNIIAFWETIDGLFGRGFSPDGTVLGEVITVAQTRNFSQNYMPEVTTLSDGGIVVVYNLVGQDGDGFGVYFNVYSNSGALVANAVQINQVTDLHQFHPTPLALSDGSFVVSWYSQTAEPDAADGGAIYAQRFSSVGERIGEVERLGEYTSQTDARNALTLLNDGRIAAVWEVDDASSSGIGGRIFDVDADVSPLDTSVEQILSGDLRGSIETDPILGTITSHLALFSEAAYNATGTLDEDGNPRVEIDSIDILQNQGWTLYSEENDVYFFGDNGHESIFAENGQFAYSLVSDHILELGNTQVLLGRTGDTLVISIRGTDGSRDRLNWVVQEPFYERLSPLLDRVLELVENDTGLQNIYITGHSLGAGMAEVAFADYAPQFRDVRGDIKVYAQNFASPGFNPDAEAQILSTIGLGAAGLLFQLLRGGISNLWESVAHRNSPLLSALVDGDIIGAAAFLSPNIGKILDISLTGPGASESAGDKHWQDLYADLFVQLDSSIHSNEGFSQTLDGMGLLGQGSLYADYSSIFAYAEYDGNKQWSVGADAGVGTDDNVVTLSNGQIHAQHIFLGHDGTDRFTGGFNSDIFMGLGGDDYFILNHDYGFKYADGGDLVDGGDGVDTVIYTQADYVIINLLDQTSNAGSAQGDRLFSIERIVGAENGDDVITGNDQDNTIWGIGGNDRLFGAGGDDFLYADGGENWSTTNDVLNGGSGFDTLITEGGEDLLIGGTDGDTYIVNDVNERRTAITIRETDTVGDDDKLVLNAEYRYGDVLIEYRGDDMVLVVQNFFLGVRTEYFEIRVENGANLAVLETLIFDEGGQQINLVAHLDRYQRGVGSAENDFFSASEGGRTFEGGEGLDTIDASGLITLASPGLANTATTSSLTVEFSENGIGRISGETFADVIISDIENIRTGSGDDLITGDNLANRIDAGAGNDSVNGAGGDDVFIDNLGDDAYNGGEGSDTLDYSRTAYSINALAENGRITIEQRADNPYLGAIVETDTASGIERYIFGSLDNRLDFVDAGDVTIFTGAGSDSIRSRGTVYSDDGDDSIFLYASLSSEVSMVVAGAGDDYMTAVNDGSDTIFDGGDGQDQVAYYSALGAVRIDLRLTEQETGGAGRDTLISIEDVSGSAFSDTLVGNDLENRLQGYRGDDRLEGLAGNDYLNGGLGNDLLLGGFGDDVLYGDAGDDDLHGNAGDDTLFSYIGNDILNGGSGFDTVDFRIDPTGVSVNLDNLAQGGIAARTAIDGWGNTDTLTNLEGVFGSLHADIIYGSAADETFEGYDGADTMDGGDGIDTLSYLASLAGVTVDLDAGTASGGDAQGDVISNFENVIGSAFDDVLVSGVGANVLTGGAGNDTASYAASAVAVNVNLQLATASGGSAAGDVLVEIENLIGSRVGDILTGDGVGNVLSGEGGNDALRGLDGDDLLDGGDGSDRLQGDDGNDTLIGGAGNDVAFGGNGNDILNGGSGIDRLTGNDGDDVFDGGADNDRIIGGAGVDTGTGGDGVDNLSGGADDDVLYGGMGNDRVQGDDGNDTLYGEDGDDRIVGGLGDDIMFGGIGNDLLIGQNGDDDFDGGDGDDIMQGGAGVNTFNAGAGHDRAVGGLDVDTMLGGAGNDLLIGNGGDDIIDGEDGDDRLEGDNGNDLLNGGLGNDLIYGGAGVDTINGGEGVDTILGGGGSDLINGDAGNDILRGEDGNDTINGGDGDDDIRGQAGFDTLNGGDGDDRIQGDDGNDTIDGGAGADTIFGGNGNDTITGGAGADILRGNAGDDTFVFAAGDSLIGAADTISDFAADDKISIAGHTFVGESAFSGTGSFEVRYSSSGGDTIIELDRDGDGTADEAIDINSNQTWDFISNGTIITGVVSGLDEGALG